MFRKLSALTGTLAAIGLVVAAIWGWGAAQRLAHGAQHPELIFWAIRSAAVAGLAAAQVLGMTFLVDLFYTRDRAGEVIRLAAGVLCTAGLIGALAFGAMGR